MEIEHLLKSLVVLWGQQGLHGPLRQLLEGLIRRREQGVAGPRVFGQIGSEFGLFQKRLQAAEVFHFADHSPDGLGFSGIGCVEALGRDQ